MLSPIQYQPSHIHMMLLRKSDGISLFFHNLLICFMLIHYLVVQAQHYTFPTVYWTQCCKTIIVAKFSSRQEPVGQEKFPSSVSNIVEYIQSLTRMLKTSYINCFLISLIYSAQCWMNLARELYQGKYRCRWFWRESRDNASVHTRIVHHHSKLQGLLRLKGLAGNILLGNGARLFSS